METGSLLTGALAVLAALAVVGGLLWRYRRLEARGTPLPPGAGGARMVGTTGTVVAPHGPGRRRGAVHVLGDEWAIADGVTHVLRPGAPVRIVDVVGTRLVVEPLDTPTVPSTDEDRDTAGPRSH